MTKDQKQSTAARFDQHTAAYLESAVHRAGDDLDQLGRWCSSATRGLDVATGAGHTAGALTEAGVDDVVATDAAPGMVETAVTAFPTASGVVCDAESLPFETGSFDAATCRIAAHHFPDPQAFVEEVARVLESGGTLAFEDNVAPDDDALDEFLNTVERLRDPTHVRSYRVSQWVDWLEAAGFTVEESRVVKKTIEYDDWVATQDTPAENRRELEATFASAPPGAEDLYELTYENGDIASFANLKLLLRATR